MLGLFLLALLCAVPGEFLAGVLRPQQPGDMGGVPSAATARCRDAVRVERASDIGQPFPACAGRYDPGQDFVSA